jgi:hypothetical protein
MGGLSMEDLPMILRKLNIVIASTKPIPRRSMKVDV